MKLNIGKFEVMTYKVDAECGQRDFGISYLPYDKGLTFDFYLYRIHFTWENFDA